MSSYKTVTTKELKGLSLNEVEKMINEKRKSISLKELQILLKAKAEKEKKIQKKREEKEFDSLKKFYLSMFFQMPRSSSSDQFIKDYGISLGNIDNQIKRKIPGASKSKVDRYKALIKQHGKDKRVTSLLPDK